MRSIRSIALIFLSVLFFQCQKEVSHIGGPDPVVILPDPISAKLQGNILDENGQPAAGVSITVGSQTATTDSKGYFSIFNASLDKKASLVTTEKTGYFKAYRTFGATSGTNQVVIKLIKKTLIGTIDATTGGNVTLANGTKIALPASGVVKASGNAAYTGTVNVYAAYIDPTSADIDETVPGSFMANDKNGARVTLSSYGMLAVELESTSAEKLQIKSGSVATLTTPIPSSLQSSAPATIALWSVDETTGIWKEEGTATKNGNVYVGDVKHFSFWNCDISIPAIHLSMTIHNTLGHALVHAHVRIKRTTGNLAQTYGWTDTLGHVSGLVPANEILLLEILDPCHNVIYTQSIGPFTTNTNLGVIIVTIPPTGIVTFNGHLSNCTGGNVTSGYAIVYFNNHVRYAAVDSLGNFHTNFIVCSSTPIIAQVLGVDNTTQQQGSSLTTVNVTTPTTNAGNLTACGNSAAQYINYTIDGTNYVISSIASDSLSAFTGNLQGTTLLHTSISGSHLNNFIGFNFNHPTSVPGMYALTTFYGGGNASTANTIIPPFNVVVTNFPLVIGQFYEGTFAGSYSNTTGTHVLTNGTFRVRKNN